MLQPIPHHRTTWQVLPLGLCCVLFLLLGGWGSSHFALHRIVRHDPPSVRPIGRQEARGARVAALTGHSSDVTAVCSLAVLGQSRSSQAASVDLVATGSYNWLALWDVRAPTRPAMQLLHPAGQLPPIWQPQLGIACRVMLVASGGDADCQPSSAGVSRAGAVLMKLLAV